VIGQAQRARYLDEALTYIKSFPDVWFATGREIADHYMTHCYDAVMDKLATWEQVP
jgi:allantoinase